mmetsp:Transcript_10788/g.10910  ORF Transcript_10788/g.10910 Transcript_10788/m.10910 type:complete len:169 (+) Transcript_10788:416-922(+)
MGGGVGVSVHAPIRIATDNAVYAMPESGIGFFADVGGSYFLARVKDNVRLGLYMGITGHRLKAKDLVKWGVATHFISNDKVPALYEALSTKVKKECSDAEILAVVESLADKEASQGSIENIDEINEIFKDDSIQQIIERLENSNSEFATKIRKQISRASPLSMAVIFE